ncbi:UHPT-like protein [Mya arenaria]|uniref:UHPT-like protein n=1 Tax=Mya arenaria TaxID=6604 RepID=A0ABY7E2S7_MYAAR|nr:UHPT-like protein [Mya arenaria]
MSSTCVTSSSCTTHQYGVAVPTTCMRKAVTAPGRASRSRGRGRLYVSYMLNVYCKRSVTFALPEIAKTEGIDKDELGIILSSQLLAYTVGKFASGILLDFVRPRILLSISLIAVGVTWFREDQFGTAWSMLSTSMNLAGFVGPLITAFISTYSGWRSSLTLPDFPTVISRWDLFKLPGYLGVCTTYFIISLLQFGTIQWQPVHLVNELGHNIIVVVRSAKPSRSPTCDSLRSSTGGREAANLEDCGRLMEERRQNSSEIEHKP